MCEKFPSFRKPEHCELVLLYQCYHSSADDAVITMLQNWTNTRDGERARLQLFKIFQIPLAPEELALALADMLTLWCLNPPADEGASQSVPASLLGLAEVLSEPHALEESYVLLLELFRSFRHAVKGLDEKVSIPIMEFLQRAVYVDIDTPPSEELCSYCEKRLLGKSHRDATTVRDADFDKLVAGLSLLEKPSDQIEPHWIAHDR